MDDRTVATVLAAGRAALGAGLVATPDLIAVPWVGPDAATPGGRVLARTLGVRDFVVGAGAVAALRQGDPVRRWLIAGLTADVVDLVVTLAAPSLPARGRYATAALAGGAALVGLKLLRSLD